MKNLYRSDFCLVKENFLFWKVAKITIFITLRFTTKYSSKKEILILDLQVFLVEKLKYEREKEIINKLKCLATKLQRCLKKKVETGLMD